MRVPTDFALMEPAEELPGSPESASPTECKSLMLPYICAQCIWVDGVSKNVGKPEKQNHELHIITVALMRDARVELDVHPTGPTSSANPPEVVRYEDPDSEPDLGGQLLKSKTETYSLCDFNEYEL